MTGVSTLLQPVDPEAAANVIQLKLRDISQLFNSLDPSPFNEKDLDHDAEEFIVSWARELNQYDELKMLIHLENAPGDPLTVASICDSVRHYFAYRASINRLEFRQLLKQGRTSLLIGICFLVGCLLLGEFIGHRTQPGAFWDIVRESLTIGGWVAMWRPMEVFLYDWWPVKRRGALLAKLSRMQVDLRVAPR
jgi:hypothetical protein